MPIGTEGGFVAVRIYRRQTRSLCAVGLHDPDFIRPFRIVLERNPIAIRAEYRPPIVPRSIGNAADIRTIGVHDDNLVAAVREPKGGERDATSIPTEVGKEVVDVIVR